ncbi:bifunctional 4-hydroxy-2-oxoglutarate aldolase/2-dehydro-3-deoxy-phosphogluconate aldolase [Alteromonas lipotrueiana]|uniref:bifunctional 4-hydroxy-2-oxoglutarate aldolase/2-dehydro-3-deoxy-phosphogluconate aldolase n=1 Tax=Alteromonas lipotrueiana TaxID=2803815 RepID=UPI001C4776DF|nr:bifunctional 4-hydroxy-2-oxoglutarate aldolase/2-dehydro-3-deoxy-phosphogluconate aldolase [Alteromonas lipotrueiana]
MKKFSSLMGEQRLLPIIQTDSPEEGVSIARAMEKAGLNVVEVVLRTPSSLQALSEIKKALPNLSVGAGTVLNAKVLEQALAAQADFIVTPAVSASLLQELKSVDVPVLPGVSNTGDILLTLEAGFNEQKLFPAALSGGPKFLSAISSVFQSVTFCPTGGVNQQNKDEYLSLPNVIAVGGTWIVPAKEVAQGNWQAITEACIQAR